MGRNGKRTVRRRLAAAFFACLLLLCLPVSAAASDPLTNYLPEWPFMEDIHEDSAVLMDAENGAILYSLNRDTTRYPASVTKIMTCLLVLENTDMDEKVTMTQTGMKEAYAGSSNSQPVEGEVFTVEQCLYMLMLKSANDIAAQLAEFTCGSVEEFADLMNERAAEIGCTGTHFNNPHGLPDEAHYTTAEDMARIMREALRNETFRKIISTTSVTIPPTNLTPTERYYENHCRLIMPEDEVYYEYCIGGKTGYTDAAQRTLVTAAEKDGRTLICVTMHGPDGSDFTDHKALMEYGFNNFSLRRIFTDENGVHTEGTVTLPTVLPTSSVKETETELPNGTIDVRYTYEELPVGNAVRTVEKTEESTSSSAKGSGKDKTSADSSGTAEGSGARTGTVKKRFSRTVLILIALLVVLVIAVGVCLYIEIREAQKRRERARRRAMREKRERRRRRRSDE